jgi:hypothetical protein
LASKKGSYNSAVVNANTSQSSQHSSNSMQGAGRKSRVHSELGVVQKQPSNIISQQQQKLKQQ